MLLLEPQQAESSSRAALLAGSLPNRFKGYREDILERGRRSGRTIEVIWCVDVFPAGLYRIAIVPGKPPTNQDPATEQSGCGSLFLAQRVWSS